MGYLQGDWIPHPNSLLFNAFPPFWGLKVFWFFRKVSRTARIIPPKPNKSIANRENCVFIRRVNSCCSRTSQSLPRATLTKRNLAITSPSRSITEHDENCHAQTVLCYNITQCFLFSNGQDTFREQI